MSRFRQLLRQKRKTVAWTAIVICLLALTIWRLWPANPRQIRVERVHQLIEHNDLMIIGTVSPNGRFLAVSDFKHIRRVPTQVFVWSLKAPFQRLAEFDGPKMQCHALCFHPIRPLLAIAGEGGVVTIADVQQQTVAQQFEVHGDLPTPGPPFDFREVRSLTFSPDGTLSETAPAILVAAPIAFARDLYSLTRSSASRRVPKPIRIPSTVTPTLETISTVVYSEAPNQ